MLLNIYTIKMKKGGSVSFVAWFAVAAVMLAAEVCAADNCSPMELTPCLGAIMGSQNPSQQCCEKLREQVPCFCGYINNPTLRPYIDSPNAKKVAAVCGLSPPTCRR